MDIRLVFSSLTFMFVFYPWGEPVYILIMIFSTVFDYCNGLIIYKFKDNKKITKIRKIIYLIK